MVAHADAEASGEPPEDHGDEEGFPTEHEERGDGAEMERDHDEEGQPDDRLREGAIGSKEVRLLHKLIGLLRAVELGVGG